MAEAGDHKRGITSTCVASYEFRRVYARDTEEIERKCATPRSFSFLRGTCSFFFIWTKMRIPGLGESISPIRDATLGDRIAEGTCSRVSTGSVVSRQTASHTEKLDRVPAAKEQNFTAKWRPGRGKLSYANRRIPVRLESEANRGRRHGIPGIRNKKKSLVFFGDDVTRKIACDPFAPYTGITSATIRFPNGKFQMSESFQQYLEYEGANPIYAALIPAYFEWETNG